MKHQFKVGDKVRIKSPHFYAGLTGKKLEIKSIDAESCRLWVKECIKTNWTNSVDPYHLELFYVGSAVIRDTRNGGFRVNLVGKNGEKMYTSEVYTTKRAAKKTLKLLPDFEIVDKTKPRAK